MTPLRVAAAGLLVLAAVLWAVRRRYDRFTAWAVEHVRSAHPDLAVQGVTAHELSGRLAGVPVRLDLAALFRRMRGRLDAPALDGVVDAMRAALPPPTPPPLASVRGAVLPLLKPAAFAALYHRYPPGLRLVARPFADGLVVVYVLLGFQQLLYVTVGACQVWDIDPDELHRLALENLRRRTERLLSALGGPRRIYAHLDGFEAARILIPDLVAPPDVREALWAVPDEHLLLVGDGGEAGRLAREAAAAFAAARRPLSPAVFRLREAALVPEVVS